MPAYDSPLIQKSFALYSGKPANHAWIAAKLSAAVPVSLWMQPRKLSAYEKPTQAGASRKIWCEKLLSARARGQSAGRRRLMPPRVGRSRGRDAHEYSLIWRLTPPVVVQSGPLSEKAPSRDEQPGPPLNHRMTGSFAFPVWLV